MSPVFFTSYSSKNRTKAFERFVKALRSHVFQQVNPALASEDEVTFFAPSTLELGDEWRPRLLDALRTSKVIVCFCSPHFFASTYCGRELGVFLERRQSWLATPGHGQHRARVIFPVHWAKPQGTLPPSLEPFQEDHVALPRKYRENGLLALSELKKERDVVTEVVIKLADAIVKALQETALPDLPGPLTIEQIQSAFDHAAVAQPYNQALVCLEPGDWSWQPYPSGPTVGDVIAPMAIASQRQWTAIDPASDVVAAIAACATERTAVIVLAAPSAVTRPAWQVLWQALEAGKPSHCAILIVWPAGTTAADQAAIEQQLRARMPEFMNVARQSNFFKIVSPTTLAIALAETSEALRMRLVQGESPQRTVDDQDGLRAEARTVSGVDIDSRPRVSGPGGGQ